MAIYYKTNEEIELMRKSSLLVGKTLAEVAKIIRPGTKTAELDRVAEQFISDNGGIPSFKGYNGYPATLCVSVNSVVVHGIPGSYELREGDIVSVDCGVLMNGFHGDSAYTFTVGDVSPELRGLLKVTKECLSKAVALAQAGRRLGDVSHVIQEHAESNGYSVVRELVGHGVGKNLHEAPEVPNFGKRGSGPVMQKGLVIAIEPMINMGKKAVKTEGDGWTIRTLDNMPSAHFEHTIAISDSKADVLSTFEYIEAVLNKKELAS
jgi:methionyl aminopeptidase